MVLRRPPVHPRPTSDKTMLREIAALRTLAGTPVPHPGFIAGCDDLDVLGVVFYLMEEVDGFNPGDSMDEAYVRDAEHAASGRAVLRGQPRPARQRRVGGQPAGGAQAAGLVSGAPGSAVSATAGKLSARRYSPESLAVTELAEWLEANRPPRWEAGNHARRPASEQRAAAPRQARSWRRSSTGRCARSATRCWTWVGC